MLSVSSLLPSANIIMDIQKGFAIHRRGIYSKTLEKAIIHTFIPIEDLCNLSPTADVCIHISRSTTPNILELSSIMSHRETSMGEAQYNHEFISSLIHKDISRILSVHNPALFINRTKKIFHYFDDQFHFVNDDINNNTTISTDINNLENKQSILSLTKRPATIILEQILNNRIALDFIRQEDIEYLCKTIMSTVNTFVDRFCIQQFSKTFLRLVVAQNIYALRTCSFTIEHMQQQTPCLLVSTLLFRPLPKSSSIFIVYELIPLPTLINNNKYMYANLPNFLGLNMLENTTAIWTRTVDERLCSFSMLVQCNEEPLITSLSASPCLLELLGEQLPTVSSCSVTRQPQIHPSIMHIGGDMWLFYNNDDPYQCRSSNRPTDPIFITKPGIYRIPCDTQIHCSSIQVPTIQCINETIFIRSHTERIYEPTSDFGLTLNNFSNRLYTTYSSGAIKTLKFLEQETFRQKSTLNKFLQEFKTWASSIITLSALTIIILVVKNLRARIKTEVDAAQKDINKLIRDFYDI